MPARDEGTRYRYIGTTRLNYHQDERSDPSGRYLNHIDAKAPDIYHIWYMVIDGLKRVRKSSRRAPCV